MFFRDKAVGECRGDCDRGSGSLRGWTQVTRQCPRGWPRSQLGVRSRGNGDVEFRRYTADQRRFRGELKSVDGIIGIGDTGSNGENEIFKSIFETK
jgi:hypothetical protein